MKDQMNRSYSSNLGRDTSSAGRYGHNSKSNHARYANAGGPPKNGAYESRQFRSGSKASNGHHVLGMSADRRSSAAGRRPDFERSTSSVGSGFGPASGSQTAG